MTGALKKAGEYNSQNIVINNDNEGNGLFDLVL